MNSRLEHYGAGALAISSPDHVEICQGEDRIELEPVAGRIGHGLDVEVRALERRGTMLLVESGTQGHDR